MWTIRKFGWLVGATLIPGLISQAHGRDQRPGVGRLSDFHHTEWSGLGAVFDIKQSSEGYLWLTTSKGVVRFDGVRFQSVEEVTRGAAPNNEIDSVFLSPSGGLWLSTEGAGLLFWKDGQLTNYPDRRCTPTRKQGKVIEDGDGSLWVQAKAGLFHLRGSTCEQVGADQRYSGGFPAGLFLDSDGTLWVKTQTGPLLFLLRGQSKFQVSKYGAGLSTGYAFLHQAPDGTIWLSDDQGLRRVATGVRASALSPPGKGEKRDARFGDFTFGPDGSMWAVTGQGIRRFDHVDGWLAPVAREEAAGASFTPEEGLSSDAVWTLLIDREGIVWVATNSGLDRLRRAAFSTVKLPHAQEHEYSVAAGDQGSVWTGNSGLPLTHVAADGTITSIPGTRQTVSVRRDHNGSIWWAGVGEFRLWRSSGERSSSLHYPDEELDSVVFVAADRDDDPWITTSSGRAYHLHDGAWSDATPVLGKKPGIIGAMTDDQAGNVWFGFSNKVVRWDGSSYHRFSFPDGKRGVSENTMFVRGDHVWLAGAGGVQLFQQGQSSQRQFTMLRWNNRDLPGRVSGVVETETGDLWVNGFSGISHVTAAELKMWLRDPTYAVSAEHLDELDGLPGLSGEILPEPSLVEASDGRLWFATTKGIAWLDPAVLQRKPNRLPPTVAISAVITSGKTYSGSNRLELPAHTENLEIDYTALSLAIPERVLFRYKLDGVDNGWQNAGTRRQAYYTKLRPGPYRFHVIACNNDGVWNEAGAILDLTVSPAWFQASWFRLLCVMCGVCLITSFYRMRVRQVAAGIDARFRERLAERTRIAQELHDTLLQGFLSVSMQVHLAKDCLPANSEAKSMLTHAVELMGQVIEEGRNAVRGLRSSHSASLDLEQAFARIQEEFNLASTNGTEVKFRVIAEGQQRPLHPLLRDEVYRIGREAVINAFRHAHANRIEVTLTYSAKQLRLLVRDDGCGIDPTVLQSGREGHWGVSGMRERAERIGARLQLFSSASAGTEVKLSVPGRVAFQSEPNGRLRWLRKRVRTAETSSQPQIRTGGAHERTSLHSHPQCR
jgi:signal transduction histidine kinase/ligand-binding sensor domain-containing protein